MVNQHNELSIAPKPSALDKLNDTNSNHGFYMELDTDHTGKRIPVLKLPIDATKTIIEAEALAISVSDLLEPMPSGTESSIIIMTALVDELGDRTRSTAVIVTINPDGPNTSLIHNTNDTSTATIVSGFRKNPNLFSDSEALATAALTYVKSRKKATLAAAAIAPPLFD